MVSVNSIDYMEQEAAKIDNMKILEIQSSVLKRIELTASFIFQFTIRRSAKLTVWHSAPATAKLQVQHSREKCKLLLDYYEGCRINYIKTCPTQVGHKKRE